MGSHRWCARFVGSCVGGRAIQRWLVVGWRAAGRWLIMARGWSWRYARLVRADFPEQRAGCPFTAVYQSFALLLLRAGVGDSLPLGCAWYRGRDGRAWGRPVPLALVVGPAPDSDGSRLSLSFPARVFGCLRSRRGTDVMLAAVSGHALLLLLLLLWACSWLRHLWTLNSGRKLAQWKHLEEELRFGHHQHWFEDFQCRCNAPKQHCRVPRGEVFSGCRGCFLHSGDMQTISKNTCPQLARNCADSTVELRYWLRTNGHFSFRRPPRLHLTDHCIDRFRHQITLLETHHQEPLVLAVLANDPLSVHHGCSFQLLGNLRSENSEI